MLHGVFALLSFTAWVDFGASSKGNTVGPVALSQSVKLGFGGSSAKE
jgi:hypothetical protein